MKTATKRRIKQILKTIQDYHSEQLDEKGNRTFAFPHDIDEHERTNGMDPQCHTITLCKEIDALLEEE